MSRPEKIKLLLASGNEHKYREFADFFAATGDVGNCVELSWARDFPNQAGEIAETGATYEENALLKAEFWADFAGIPAIADDSGIEVRCLGWGPGVRSARAASGSDAERVRWMLDSMAGSRDRRACFVACVAIAFPAKRPAGRRGFFSAEGSCAGNIALRPAGNFGFGYDPIFVPDGHEMTFAELGPEVKSKISHRAVAMRGVALALPSVIKYNAVCRSALQN
ncbi:MAG: non-canonical purine NTP pyrophosphatase [Synergistaceae bacterium]|nr:non-canonical purine NTP pyrophosphatase [Synergistaceae bacterium]